MPKIKIFTDSSADLPRAMLERYSIGVVPLVISHGGNSFADGVDLGAEDFYALMAGSETLPTTSQPSPQDFLEAFSPHLLAGETVVSVNISSGLSGTIESALLAQDDLGKTAAGRLHIVDSLSASMGQGLLTVLAARWAEEGVSAPEIVARLLAARENLKHLFTLDTMENLVKGGRISRTKATLGEVLNIKPLLWITEEGKIDNLDKVRGRKKSLKYLADRCLAEVSRDSKPLIGISQAACPADADHLAAEIRGAVPEADIIIGDIGATIGTHTGAGCLGIFYFK